MLRRRLGREDTMIRKPIWPYLVVGYFHCYFPVLLPLLPTFDCSSTFHGNVATSLVARTLGTLLFGVFFDSGALYAGLIGFGLPMLVYASWIRIYIAREKSKVSARFATLKEMRRFEDVDFEKNMIFSKQVKMGLFNFRLAYNVQLNKNVIVIGLPGDGKTFTFVLPNLMQMNSNFVVTDPKGNLVHEVGKMLESWLCC